jgi:hypothetical protein
MKYKVGDLIVIKDMYPLLLPRLRQRLVLRLHIRLHLKNTLGIITEVEESSTEKDNGYIWYSQVDGKEYHFYQDEVDGEVIK